MEYTGYKIIQYIDDNPNSPTYGHIWEEKVYDFENCSLGDDDWIVISDGCELDVTGYTGNRITVYYNSKTDSYSSVTVYDESCVASSSEEIWEATGEERCEEVDGAYTGYKIQIQKQTNRNLANYGQKREYKYISPDCKRRISCAVWDEISRSCHIAVNNCNLTFDGTADVVQIDSNPLSETYNKTRTINVEDTGTCTNCTETTFAYKEIGDFCGYDVCYSGLTEGNPPPKNLYTISQKQKVINGVTIPMDEFNVVLKEEDSEKCGYIRPRYRWVATQSRVCVEHDLYIVEKEQVSYDLGETWADYYVDGKLVTRTAETPIVRNAYVCGYPMYRWVNTDETECDICENPDYRWVIDEGNTVCDGVALRKVERQQISCDNGETWEDTTTTRMGETIDEYSEACGLEDYLEFFYGENGNLIEAISCEESYVPSRYKETNNVKKVVIEGCSKNCTFVADCTTGQFGFSIKELVIGDSVETISNMLIYSVGTSQSIRSQMTKITFGKNLKRVSSTLFYTPLAPLSAVKIYFTGEYPPVFEKTEYKFGSGVYTWYAPLEYKENYRTLFFFDEINFI